MNALKTQTYVSPWQGYSGQTSPKVSETRTFFERSSAVKTGYPDLTLATIDGVCSLRVVPPAENLGVGHIGFSSAGSFLDRGDIYTQQRMGQLETKIRELETENQYLRNRLGGRINVRCIEVLDIPPIEAKQRVLEYYQSHKKAYPSEIATELGLGLETIFNAVDELVAEGKISASNEVDE